LRSATTVTRATGTNVPDMRNVKLGIRIVAIATVAFFIVAFITNTATGPAAVALLVATLATILVTLIDLATRRRQLDDDEPTDP
jgi:hypothetical protein